MLTKYIKQRCSRPNLSEVKENPIPLIKPTALDFLKSLKPGELLLQESESDGEDDIDPCADLKAENNIDRGLKKARKRLTKLQKSLETLRGFTDEFKRAMEEVKTENEVNSSIYYEDMNQIDKTLLEANAINKNIPEDFQLKLDDIFREEYFNCGPDLDIPDRDPDLPEQSEGNTDVDNMSGMWNLLNTKNELICTGPDYDAFRQQTPHWLDRPEIPWTTLNDAKEKCEEWMKQQEEAEHEKVLQKKK